MGRIGTYARGIYPSKRRKSRRRRQLIRIRNKALVDAFTKLTAEMDMASCMASTFDFDYSGDTDWGSGNIHCEDNMSIKREDDENKTHIPITTVWVKTEVNATGYEPIEIARNKYETHLDTEETSYIENIKNEFVAGSKNSVSINKIENERNEINSTTTFECVKSSEVDVKFEPYETIGNKDATCLKTEVASCGYGSTENTRTEFASNSKNVDSIIKTGNEINEMDSATTFECIKSEGMDIKCEPIEAVGNKDAAHSEVKGKGCGYGNTENKRKAFASDSKHLDSVSERENKVNEMDDTATFECIKSEEIDIKYEPHEAVGLSSTINGEIGIGSYRDCYKLLTPRYIPLVDLTIEKDNLPEKPTYKCSLCSYEGKRKNYLTKHMKYHHVDPSEIQMYNCGICSYTTRHRKCWKEHKVNFSHLTEEEEREFKNERPPEKPIYKCSTCGYSPQFKKDLLKHISEHKPSDFAEEDIFKCDQCDYRATMERNLKAHVLNVHTSEMHKCSKCNYANKRKSSLKAHMLKHLDVSAKEMYKCDKCNYTTAYKRALKSHSLYHKNPQEVEMHSCDQCSYETKYKRALKIHRDRSHVKPLNDLLADLS